MTSSLFADTIVQDAAGDAPPPQGRRRAAEGGGDYWRAVVAINATALRSPEPDYLRIRLTADAFVPTVAGWEYWLPRTVR